MGEYTTVRIKTSQKEALDELKRVDSESYDSVVAMLIANYSNSQGGEIDSQEVREIAREEINELVRFEALE